PRRTGRARRGCRRVAGRGPGDLVAPAAARARSPLRRRPRRRRARAADGVRRRPREEPPLAGHRTTQGVRRPCRCRGRRAGGAVHDEEIRAAYRRMTTAAQPAADALDRVGARVRRPRRARAALTAGLAVAVLAGAGGVAAPTLGDDGPNRRTDVRATDLASVTPSAPAAAPLTSVVCPSEEALRTVVFDHAGYPTFTKLAVESGAVDQAAWV